MIYALLVPYYLAQIMKMIFLPEYLVPSSPNSLTCTTHSKKTHLPKPNPLHL